MNSTPIEQRAGRAGDGAMCAEFGSPSAEAKARMERTDGEPLLLADWTAVLMAHFEVDPARLQRLTPFALGLFHGRAFVSLVVFHMDRMRLRIFPGPTESLFAPFTRSCRSRETLLNPSPRLTMRFRSICTAPSPGTKKT